MTARFADEEKVVDLMAVAGFACEEQVDAEASSEADTSKTTAVPVVVALGLLSVYALMLSDIATRFFG